MAKAPRIVLLDADLNTRKLLAAALDDDDRNAEILSVSAFEEALAEVKNKGGVDLVIADHAAPKAGGWEGLKILREAGRRVPILIVSKSTSEAGMARAMELGADDYLGKPIDLPDYRRTVARMLQERRDALAAKDLDDREASLSVRSEAQGMLVEVHAPSGSMHVSRFERFAHRLLMPRLSEEEGLKFRLALEELITNAKEWGNQGDTRKPLKLSYCLMTDRVTFRIEDQGEGFNPSEVPDPTRDPLAHVKRRRETGKRVGGWGILLARKSVDEVQYNRKGNVVFVTKYLRRGAGPAPAEAPAADTSRTP